jgi:hypothetical protein
MAFLFPISTIGKAGNFKVFCQSEKTKKKIIKEDARMVKVIQYLL